ncbi:Pre-rRNA-processing protein ipi3 [Tulasnella sp. 424]|nr:Pre-rRNA-processing protein ipi3 [Tulasnella sp. 424]
MKIREVVCCSVAPPSATLGLGSIALYDIQTGSQLASFKQTSASIHSTAIVGTKAEKGGLIVASQPDKAILNVYTFQKEQLYLKIVLPEKLTCITTDTEGRYCAGGTANGKIYLWEVASGILFNAFDAHYRKITVLRFTLDGAALVSGSEDSRVTVWTLSSLLDNDLQHEIPTPYCTLADHTLPISDIKCDTIHALIRANMPIDFSLLFEPQLWEISSTTLLATFIFPQPITILAFDLAERAFFAASQDGSIHQVNLFRQRKNRMGHETGSLEAVGGMDEGGAMRIDDEDVPTRKRLISAGQEATSLAISFTGSTLLVGTATGVVQVYDIPSHQLIRSINVQQGFAVTHVCSFLKPLDLVGQMTIGGPSTTDNIPVRPISSFHRIRDQASRDAHEVPVMLPIPSETPVLRGGLPPYDFLADHRFFMGQQSETGATSTQSLQSRIAELEGELASMKQNLTKAKGLNDAMWETVVSSVLGSENSKTREEETGESRKSKKARVNGK